ncbi:MAG: DNA polymerase III subunit alpha [bacterium]|nr:DNA polymerase III subunit alpha [bacterium]
MHARCGAGEKLEIISKTYLSLYFPDIYRDQVIEYVISKYGSKKVSGIVTFGTLAAKQAIRDVSRILNIPTYQVDLINKKIPAFTKLKLNDFYRNDPEFKNLIDSDPKIKKMFVIASKIEGFPRHTSSHAAGIVMCKTNLDEVIPLTKNDGIYLTGFSMEYLEELGLLKMDFLGLRTLTTIMHVLEDIKKGEGIEIDFHTIPLDDPDVIDCFKRADTTGIFQFESSGMRNFLRNLKPDCFEDIFAAIALFRPGPAGNIDSYIRRKEGLEKITYLDPCLEPILKSTKGIIIYQEQIIQIANQFAGYTLGEADVLRRAMSKKKMEVLKQEEAKFIQKSMQKGHQATTAKLIFDLILNFANYGFNRSHSVAYSLVAYKMAYLKVKYPKYFYASLLSSVIGSDTKINEYINEVKAKGLKILHPDINKSQEVYTVEKDGIRYPLSAIKNIGVASVKIILENRTESYHDIFDFISKTMSHGMSTRALESLIDAGCLKNFGLNQHTLNHNLDSIVNYAELVKDLDPEFVLKPNIEQKEEYPKKYLIQKEKELFGIYLSNHPVTFYKANETDMISTNQISNYFNQKITLIVLIEKVKKICTKKGEEMVFLLGSDEYQSVDLTMFPKVYWKYQPLGLKKGDIIKVIGRVERRYDAFQIIVDSLTKLNSEEAI